MMYTIAIGPPVPQERQFDMTLPEPRRHHDMSMEKPELTKREKIWFKLKEIPCAENTWNIAQGEEIIRKNPKCEVAETQGADRAFAIEGPARKWLKCRLDIKETKRRLASHVTLQKRTIVTQLAHARRYLETDDELKENFRQLAEARAIDIQASIDHILKGGKELIPAPPPVTDPPTSPTTSSEISSSSTTGVNPTDINEPPAPPSTAPTDPNEPTVPPTTSTNKPTTSDTNEPSNTNGPTAPSTTEPAGTNEPATIPPTTEPSSSSPENDAETGVLITPKQLHYYADVTGNFAVHMQEMFITCDLVDFERVGDYWVPLLRSMALDNGNSDVTRNTNTTRTFARPYYKSILKDHIEMIEVEMRTKQGQFVPFEGGSSLLTLHFRRKRGVY